MAAIFEFDANLAANKAKVFCLPYWEFIMCKLGITKQLGGIQIYVEGFYSLNKDDERVFITPPDLSGGEIDYYIDHCIRELESIRKPAKEESLIKISPFK